jgi:hypothetical protein
MAQGLLWKSHFIFLWRFMKLDYLRGNSPIPSFIMFYISLNFLEFTRFLRSANMTECHVECHRVPFRIKFYMTFNASATRFISLNFSSSVICTYRFIVIPILEWPRICCNVLCFMPASMHLVAKVCLKTCIENLGMPTRSQYLNKPVS